MNNIPLEDRPRERLFNVGEDALSDSELLAIILGSGTTKVSAVALAQNILKQFGGLNELAEASFEELCSVHGVGKVKAIEMRALFALTKRILKRAEPQRLKIGSPDAAYHALIDLFYGEKKEILAILMLDSRLNLIGREVIGVGTLTEVIVHPREVFSVSIKRGAHSIVVAHNHPSNDASPSESDKKLTQKLALAGQVLDLQVSDHLIICNDNFFSFKESMPLCLRLEL